MKIDLSSYQCHIEGYVSDMNCLCLAFNEEDVVNIDGKGVLIIRPENAERFVLGLSKLLQEVQNG